VTSAPKFARLGLAIFLVISGGCAQREDLSFKRETSHVRSLTNLYGLATTKLGHLPRDEKEFKQSIATLGVKPEKMKVTSIDELFVSDRDGQPLVVVYGIPPGNSDVVVYERTGVGGKHLVGHRIGMVEEVDEARYKDLPVSKH